MITLDTIFENSNEEILLDVLKVIPSESNIDVERLFHEYKHGSKNLVPLYDRWIVSVDNEMPDFTVYDCDDYLIEAFNCWKIYSKRYLRLLNKYINTVGSDVDRNEIKAVLDLGCGIGLTTIGLKNIFSEATIFGTNLETSYQYSVASTLCAEASGDCKIIGEDRTLNCGKIDLVFASEFFEHLQEPINLLLDLINVYRPKYFVIANTFTKMSLGHFNEYYYANTKYDGKSISRLFNNTLRNYGYIKVDTGFFNNRPAVWKLMPNKQNRLI